MANVPLSVPAVRTVNESLTAGRNPLVKFRLSPPVKVTVSDWEPYWDKLQTLLAGGAAPDVFAMDGPLFPDYAGRDVLLDLSSYIQAESYPLSSLADLAVKDFATSDGRQMGLPRDLNVIALFYNKKMFDAAGIPYPDDSWDVVILGWGPRTD